MWSRTKRLINSYLDGLIEKVSGPDREVRNITRGEMARLNELEAQSLASAKMMEKELAEVELKLVGAVERERLARERGDGGGASNVASEIGVLLKHQDLLKQQVSEARSAATRARLLREQRRRVGEELATETYLTAMREQVARTESAFNPADPAATIDEMRERINRGAAGRTPSAVAAADRELEMETARARVEEILARYKQSTGARSAAEPVSSPTTAADAQPDQPDASRSSKPDEQERDEPQKTLGRTDGPVHPID